MQISQFLKIYISQFLKIYKPQMLYLSHVAKRKVYYFKSC